MTYELFVAHSELMLRIVVACICGYLIGYERKNRNKGAGIRTHAIVALGAALIMVISKYGFTDVGGSDGTRVAAQIVSGIGFIGAGIIFVKNNTVSGLTTAAGIWATSGVGMAIGAGMYYIGICSSILIVAIQIIMHRDIFLMQEPSSEYISLVVLHGQGGMEEIQEEFKKQNIEIISMQMQRGRNDNLEIDVQVILPIGYHHMELVKLLSANKSIIKVNYDRQ